MTRVGLVLLVRKRDGPDVVAPLRDARGELLADLEVGVRGLWVGSGAMGRAGADSRRKTRGRLLELDRVRRACATDGTDRNARGDESGRARLADLAGTGVISGTAVLRVTRGTVAGDGSDFLPRVTGVLICSATRVDPLALPLPLSLRLLALDGVCCGVDWLPDRLIVLLGVADPNRECSGLVVEVSGVDPLVPVRPCGLGPGDVLGTCAV